MKLSAVLLALALPALAQAQAQPTVDSTAPHVPAGASGTVSGVTVEGRKTPAKACGARDSTCIAAVVAELKARYPKQLQQWCDHVQERAAMTDLMFDRSADGSPDGHPHENPVPYLPPPVTKVACVADKPAAAGH
ncbi:MAG: hypothetical protein JSR98_07190 [Proteobacteria bacterium]|nr:hypothetical protein [Pseudomonadota bacterium]